LRNANERREQTRNGGHLSRPRKRRVAFVRTRFLYVYCRDALGLSEGESYNRIEVARAARRFPVILEMLAAGAVNLTAARLLAPHLTPGNHREVLDSARGKKKREIEEIVARLSPRPDVAASVRKLPAVRLQPFPPTDIVEMANERAAISGEPKTIPMGYRPFAARPWVWPARPNAIPLRREARANGRACSPGPGPPE
jgi:hypothetical protein